MGMIDERRKQNSLEVITEEHETHKQLANMAEVELIFENLNGEFLENGNKLVIKRQLRVPTSGNFYSVYKLNEKESSRSEILKTLKKFGIEPDGYNIIKQGEISTRMKDTPESRKKLIEIVSGLSEFDPMIAEVESKINNARNNLKQTEILLNESKRHLNQLEKERDRAIEYKQLQTKLNRLKGLKIRYRKIQYLQEIEDLNEEIKKIRKIIHEVESESDEVFKEIKEYEHEKEEIQLKIIELERKRSSLNGQAKSLDDQIREIELKIKQNEEKFKYQDKDRKTALAREMHKLELEKKELVSQIEDNIKKNNKLQAEIKRIRNLIEKFEVEIPELQQQNKSILFKISSLKDEINAQTRVKDRIDKEISQLRIRKEGVDKKFDEISEENITKNRKLIQIDAEINRLQLRKKKLTRNINSISKFFEDSLEELKKITQDQPILKRDIKNMEHNLDNYELQMKSLKPRYSNDIKKILEEKNKGHFSGLIGTILDLIDLENLDLNYAKAIEAAIGNFFEHLVVKNYDAAKDIIKFIKENDLGEITIYLLDDVKGWDEKPIPKGSGIVDKIINLINFEPKYRPLLSFLFKDTVLVKDLDTAYSIHNKFRAVTLDGEVVEPKGYIVTQGKFEPRFLLLSEFYKEKIKSLKDRISREKVIYNNIQKRIEQIYEKREKDAKRKDDLNRTIGQVEGKLVELVNNKSDLEQEITDNKTQINDLNNLIVDYQVEIQNKQMDLAKAFNELDFLKSEKEKLNEDLKNTEYGHIEKDIRKNQGKMKKLRNEVKSLERKRNAHKNQLNEIESHIAIRRERYNQAIVKIDDLKKEKNSLEKHMEELISKMESQSEVSSNLYLEIKALEDQQKKIQDAVELKKEEQGFKTNQISKLNDRINSLNNLIARKGAFIEESENKLNEMGIELDTISDIDIDEVNTEMYSLENQMRLFGLVDPNAPEKFESEKLKFEERLDKKEFYTKELEEASEAFSDLLEQKKTKFLKTLDRINIHLDRIFKKFYKDGSAHLFSQNKKDPLNSGIEVRVDLGSGNINNIKSLSGGETSLVAISVILAIQEFEGKSAPFYFLDEMDAHLDNTKGEKLAHLLAEMANKHQYIIVTPKNKYLAKLANRVFSLSKNGNGFSSIQYISRENFPIVN